MKIQEVKRILTRWQPSSFSLYREVFTQYGGSINMHPDIVDYFMKRYNWHFKLKMIRLKAPTLSVMIRILAS